MEDLKARAVREGFAKLCGRAGRAADLGSCLEICSSGAGAFWIAAAERPCRCKDVIRARNDHQEGKDAMLEAPSTA